MQMTAASIRCHRAKQQQRARWRASVPLSQSLLALLLLLFTIFTVTPLTDAALTATRVTPASLAAGASTEAHVAFTTSNELPIGSQLRVTFPSDFLVATDAAQVTVNTAFATTLTLVTVSTNSVTMTLGSAPVAAAGEFQFTITSITNPAAQTTDDFTIKALDELGVTTDADLNVGGVTIVSTAFSAASVLPLSLEAGVSGLARVKFTSAVSLPVGSAVLVSFAHELSVASTAGALGAGAVVSGMNAASVVSMVSAASGANGANGAVVKVTIAGSGVSAGDVVEFELDGVTNPGAVVLSGSFGLQSTDSVGRVFEEALSIAGVTIVSTAFDFNSVVLGIGTKLAGVLNSMTLMLITSVGVPKDGFVVVELPPQILSLSGTIVMDETAVGLFVTGSVSGSVLRFQMPSLLPAGSYSFTISGIRNPGACVPWWQYAEYSSRRFVRLTSCGLFAIQG